MEIKFNPNLSASVRLAARSPKPPAELPSQDRADFNRLDHLDRSLREMPVVRPEVLAKADYFRSEQYPPEKTIESLSVLMAAHLPANPPELS